MSKILSPEELEAAGQPTIPPRKRKMLLPALAGGIAVAGGLPSCPIWSD